MPPEMDARQLLLLMYERWAPQATCSSQGALGLGAEAAGGLQQQGLQAIVPITLLAQSVSSCAHKVMHRLVHLGGDAYHGRLARASLPSQLQAIAPICLHSVAAGPGDRRGRDHLAVPALRADVAPAHAAGGACRG